MVIRRISAIEVYVGFPAIQFWALTCSVKRQRITDTSVHQAALPINSNANTQA